MFDLKLPFFILLVAAGACGAQSESGGGAGGAGGEAAFACDVDDFYARAYASRTDVCQKVTSCYGAPPEGADCYVPLPAQDGGLSLVISPQAPTAELRVEGECLCSEDGEAMTELILCSEQADAALAQCLEDCPEDPEPCAAEYVVTCGAYRSRLEALMQREGACFRGEDESESSAGSN